MKALILLFTLYFGVLSAAPNLQGIQFFKLQNLFEHYSQHQNSSEHFNSFADFIVDHYLKNHTTNDNERELPFKTIQSNMVLIYSEKIAILPITDFIEIQSITKPVFGEPLQKSSNNPSIVWNPPKIMND